MSVLRRSATATPRAAGPTVRRGPRRALLDEIADSRAPRCAVVDVGQRTTLDAEARERTAFHNSATEIHAQLVASDAVNPGETSRSSRPR